MDTEPPPPGFPAPEALATCVDLDRLAGKTATWREDFADAPGFPHLHVHALLRAGIAEAVGAAFPRPDDPVWTHYRHVNEDKLGSPKRAAYPAAVGQVVDALQTPEFVAWLAELTGIPGLFADPELEGAGMHMSSEGGFLNVHTDFQRHHHHPSWRRTVNLILFLNPDWDPAWGGSIELWDPTMTDKVADVLPHANHAVIFRSDEHSFHGHPEPLACPPGHHRKSLALYYYTLLDGPLAHEYSRFVGRPGDGLMRKVAMRLDNHLVQAFSWLKRKGMASDSFASRVLKGVAERQARAATRSSRQTPE